MQKSQWVSGGQSHGFTPVNMPERRLSKRGIIEQQDGQANCHELTNGANSIALIEAMDDHDMEQSENATSKKAAARRRKRQNKKARAEQALKDATQGSEGGMSAQDVDQAISGTNELPLRIRTASEPPNHLNQSHAKFQERSGPFQGEQSEDRAFQLPSQPRNHHLAGPGRGLSSYRTYSAPVAPMQGNRSTAYGRDHAFGMGNPSIFNTRQGFLPSVSRHISAGTFSTSQNFGAKYNGAHQLRPTSQSYSPGGFTFAENTAHLSSRAQPAGKVAYVNNPVKTLASKKSQIPTKPIPSKDTKAAGNAVKVSEPCQPVKEGKERNSSLRTRHLLPRPVPSPAYLQQASRPLNRLARPNPLLIIMDLNGCLLDRGKSKTGKGSHRPFLNDLLSRCLQNHKVMVWSSATPSNVKTMAQEAFSSHSQKPIAVWDRSTLRLSSSQAREKVQVYKQLQWIWEDKHITKFHPYGGKWDQSNTILIDDSKEKAAAQPHNELLVPEYKKQNAEKEVEQQVLRKVADYIDAAAYYADVSTFIFQHPFEVWVKGQIRFGAAETSEETMDVAQLG